jgi:hypothetical protein
MGNADDHDAKFMFEATLGIEKKMVGFLTHTSHQSSDGCMESGKWEYWDLLPLVALDLGGSSTRMATKVFPWEPPGDLDMVVKPFCFTFGSETGSYGNMQEWQSSRRKRMTHTSS